MKLLVVSHKETWKDAASPSGYSTKGGFPFQMKALSELFEETQILSLQRAPEPPSGLVPLTGYHLQVKTLPEPKGHDLERKLRLMLHLPRWLITIWREAANADAVHTPLPGDFGTIGMLVALLQKKPLFVRHCGRWGIPSSRFDAWLQRFLERIAGSRNVVMATGGADHPPSRRNPAISWIFSTAMTEAELQQTPIAKPWQPGKPLRLVTVGSLLPGKNISALIAALPLLGEQYPELSLEVIGTGRLLEDLQQQTRQMGLEDVVNFSGNLSHNEVLERLASSHVFVFPTLYEGFPKALLEAMACGLPIVASPVSVIPRLLEGGAGFLLGGQDAASIAAGISELLSDPEKMAAMGELARQRAQRYTLERWRDEIGQRLSGAWGEQLKHQVEAPDQGERIA